MHIISTKISGLALALIAVAGFAVAPSALAGHGHRGHWGGRYHGHYDGGYRHYRGHWDGYHRGWHRRGGHYDSLGRWVAGAVVASALVNIVAAATAPRTVYYDAPPPPPPPPVGYRQYRQPTVIYEDSAPTVIEHRVETTRVYTDPDQTRYIRDDGWDGHGN